MKIGGISVSSSTETPEQLSWFVDNTVTKRLLAVSGVAQVQRGGGVNREIRIELDPARMQALGITAVDVNRQIRELNLDSPGGRAQVGGGEQSIRVLGGAHTAQELSETHIALPGAGQRYARLSDIAVVRDGVGEVRSIARLNGRPATTLGSSGRPTRAGSVCCSGERATRPPSGLPPRPLHASRCRGPDAGGAG